jgi:hypothetical protein
MPKKIREEVFNRIIFAKKLYKDGELACNIENDQMVFSMIIFLLLNKQIRSIELCHI